MARPHPHQPGYPTRRRSLYGDATTHRRGGVEHADEFGTDIAVRPEVVPPVAEYDAWLRSRNYRSNNNISGIPKTGFRLRRIVIMRRAGSSWAECGDAVGISSSSAREWVKLLPLRLGV